MCKQIAMRWLFCNKVVTVMLITVDRLVKMTGTKKWRWRWQTYWRKGRKGKWMCSSKENLYLFSTPPTKDYVMVIQMAKRVVHVSEFVGCMGWPGWCEISRPEILSQSAPDRDLQLNSVQTGLRSSTVILNLSYISIFSLHLLPHTAISASERPGQNGPLEIASLYTSPPQLIFHTHFLFTGLRREKWMGQPSLQFSLGCPCSTVCPARSLTNVT